MKKILVVLIFLIVVGALVATLFFRKQTKETQGLASELVNKIESYKVDKGSYPQQLTDLIPDYYQELPTTTHNLNNQFTYRLFNDSLGHKFFLINYNESLGVEVVYDSRTKEWHFDD